MPAGVSWSAYLKFTFATMLAMFAGAQTVHLIYRPMDDFDRYVQEAVQHEQQHIVAQKSKSTESAPGVSKSN